MAVFTSALHRQCWVDRSRGPGFARNDVGRASAGVVTPYEAWMLLFLAGNGWRTQSYAPSADLVATERRLW